MEKQNTDASPIESCPRGGLGPWEVCFPRVRMEGTGCPSPRRYPQSVPAPNPYEAPGCQETNDPQERIACFFAAGLVLAPAASRCVLCLHCHRQAQTARGGPTHFLRRSRRRDAAGRATAGASSAVEPQRGALRPSSAMKRLHGYRAPVRGRCGGGAAPVSLRGPRRRPQSRSERPIHAAGAGMESLEAPRRAMTPSRRAARALGAGGARPGPVRRQARPLRSMSR
jgi:hypothetical protein